MNTRKKSNSRNLDVDDKKLWQDLRIEFRLESLEFPDNKIYGTVHVIPESSRKLIKKFELIVNKINRVKFDRDYVYLSASGFQTIRKNPSAYIEAIPNNSKWKQEVKKSNVCYFCFTGEVFALSPTISFKWSDDQIDPKPSLIVNWYHIGDRTAQRYILYLDNQAIQYIHQSQIEDVFNIIIHGFECGDEHTFQLVARLNNGKETYRSDLIEFIVPERRFIDNENIEFITVTEEVPPPNLPVVIETNENETEKNPKQNENKQKSNQYPPKSSSQHEKNLNLKRTYACCNQLPHETFPGIDHYLKNVFEHYSSVDTDKKTIYSTINDNDTDDDADVFMTSDNRN